MNAKSKTRYRLAKLHKRPKVKQYAALVLGAGIIPWDFIDIDASQIKVHQGVIEFSK